MGAARIPGNSGGSRTRQSSGNRRRPEFWRIQLQPGILAARREVGRKCFGFCGTQIVRYNINTKSEAAFRRLPVGVHDWSRVDAGIFHDFHVAWIGELRRALNGGFLPPEYYALAEQYAGKYGPDVLTLQHREESDEHESSHDSSGTGELALAPPPKVRFTAKSDMMYYVAKQNTVVVRHVSGDHVVAIIEVVSPGNKSSQNALRKFVEKAAG